MKRRFEKWFVEDYPTSKWVLGLGGLLLGALGFAWSIKSYLESGYSVSYFIMCFGGIYCAGNSIRLLMIKEDEDA